MSDIIHILPDAVANQIAAGEVIQRPASVVKELVENAIDAGATLIQVFIVDAGKTSIQVVDDGKGMSETDARLSFERHATSKIAKANDLFSLRTMGFRGEALASIAAVAQVELKTRREGDDLGTHITIEGSRLKDQSVVSTPRGANFLVKNLFYNIPARRKFLKSNSTEMSNIIAEFERIALANPEVAFRLSNGDTVVLDLPKANSHQRIVNVFGRRMESQLIPVQVETPLVSISGFVGSPESARKKSTQQFFFVNGRFMRHPYFAKAILQAFERLLPEGMQIPYFLYLEVDPAKIDVNIHPTKTEIKFEDEPSIFQILLAAVRESLGRFNAIPTIDFDQAGSPEIPVFTAESFDVSPPSISVNAGFNPFASPSPSAPSSRPHAGSTAARPSAHAASWQTVYEEALRPAETPAMSHPQPLSPALAAELQMADEAACFQWQNRYIVTTVKSQLVLIDQHRAHLRVLYDQFLALFAEQAGVSQGLLFPQRVELSPSLLFTYRRIEPNLLRAGFDLVRPADEEHTLLLQGIPAGTEGIDAVEFIQNIVDQAAMGEVQAEEEINHLLALALAQRKAIPAGKHITPDEAMHLVSALFQTDSPALTPEGEKILTTIDEGQISTWFGS